MGWKDIIPPTNWGPDVINNLSALWNAWAGIAVMAVIVSFSLIALAYMLAKLLNSEGLMRWARQEIYHALANAVLVAGLIGLVTLIVGPATAAGTGLMTQIGANIASQLGITTPVDNPFYLANFFIDESLQCLRTWWRRVFITNLLLEPLEKFSVGIDGMDAVGGSLFLHPLITGMYMVAHNTTFIMLANFFMRTLLVFSYQTMFPIFLPLGIILRTFPFTRGLGGLLIASALGLYIVFPVSLSMGFMLTRSMVSSGECIATPETLTAAGVEISDPASFFFHKARMDREVGGVVSLLDLWGNVLPFFIVRSFFMPLVAGTATFTFIRASSTFFGADIAELGRGLFKLI